MSTFTTTNPCSTLSAYHASANNQTFDMYSSEETAVSTFSGNFTSSSLQSNFPSDLPDLFYDHNWPSPTSATSSNMLSTPPVESQLPHWHNTEMKVLPNNVHPSQWHTSSLSSCQVSRFTIPPIDTNCSWKYPNIHKSGEQTSILFTPLSNLDQAVPKNTAYSYSQPLHNHSQISSSNSTSAPSSTSTDILRPNSLSNVSMSSSVSRTTKRTRSPLPLKIHQPRPSRRIPIISLSELASASEDSSIHPRAKKSEYRNPEIRRNSNGRSSLISTSSFANVTSNPYVKSVNHFAHNVHSQNLQLSSKDSAKASLCPCGCMEYTFHK